MLSPEKVLEIIEKRRKKVICHICHKKTYEIISVTNKKYRALSKRLYFCSVKCMTRFYRTERKFSEMFSYAQ